jgi:autotransporter-associated beta strand protein
VEIKKDADIAGGTLVLNGGTLNLQGNLSHASTLVLAADTVSTIDSSAKGGVASLGYTTIRGGGSLILSGTCDIGVNPNSAYLGNTRIALAGGKRLLVSGNQPFGTVGRVTFAGQGALAGQSGPVAMSVGGSIPAAIPNDLHLESSVVYSQTYNNITLKLTGNISGPGGLTKTFDDKDRGTRLLLLGRNNSFSGGIDFRSGHLLVMKNSMGSGPVTLGGKATTEHAVAFMNMIPMEVHNPITLIGIPDGATPQPAAMTEFHVASRLEIAGTLAGTGGLLKTGSDRMVLSGISAFTGPTVVQTGTLAITRPAAFGRGSIEIAEGAKLQLGYTGSHRLAALRIAGKDLPAGTYGGQDSIATSKMPANFTGPGMVTIGDASPTTTTVTIPPAPLQVGKVLVFTAAVTGTAPTGTVAFFADGKRLGEAPLKDGVASFSTDKLTAGWQTITAGYEGNAANIPSLSATLDLEISPQ